MIQSGDMADRHTIPRWNSTVTAELLGELSPIKLKQDNTSRSAGIENYLKSLLHEWKSEKNLPLAVEILSLSQEKDELEIQAVRDYALDAIKKMDYVPPLLFEAICDERYSISNNKSENDKSTLAIAALRRSLSQYPRNPLVWCELARQYLIIGQTQKSEHSLKIARLLAPNHRSVLRAIAHFYSHISNPEKGLYFLRKSPAVTADPWILAPEIALSNELNRTSKNVKIGSLMIENQNLNPISISELASELGTMDYISGNRKKGRKKLELAVLAPHENSVAQMAWINQRVCNIEQIMCNIAQNPLYNYEANAKHYFVTEDWSSAMDETFKWQEYQPFSRFPALEGSFIANDYLCRPDLALKILEQGMTSNPDDISIQNNYIYSLIMANELKKAEKELSKYKLADMDSEEFISLIATFGLFHYRKGNPNEGRELYRLAIDQASRFKHPEISYLATVYFAREERRTGVDISAQLEYLAAERNKPYYAVYQTLMDKFGLFKK